MHKLKPKTTAWATKPVTACRPITPTAAQSRSGKMYETAKKPLFARTKLVLKSSGKTKANPAQQSWITLSMLVFADVGLTGLPSPQFVGSGSVTDAAVRAWGEIVNCAQRGHGLAVATAAAQGAFTVRDRLQTEPRLAATLAAAEVASAAFAFALNRDGDLEEARRVAAVTLTKLASDLPRAIGALGDAVYWID